MSQMEVPMRAPLEKGSLLVAMPPLVDGNFHQTVVLLCAVDPEGCLGLVLNRPTNMQLSEALPDEALLKDRDIPIFDGGPVADDRILILRQGGSDADDFSVVFDDITLGGSIVALKEAATSQGIMGDFRPYRGYAGWSQGQLESELDQGAWALIPAAEGLIFSDDPASLWSRAMASLGGVLAMYATMPEDLESN